MVRLEGIELVESKGDCERVVHSRFELSGKEGGSAERDSDGSDVAACGRDVERFCVRAEMSEGIPTGGK